MHTVPMRAVASLGVSTSVVILSTLLTPVSHAATNDYSADASWVVPAGVSVVQVTISGGNGGSFPGSSSLSREAGGAGYTVTAGVSVTAGERIYIGLGANGGDAPTPPATSPAGSGGVSAFGIDPGGSGGSNGYGSGAGGGGASAVAVDDTIILIAGGGGGAGSAYEDAPFSPPSAGVGGGYGGFGGGKGGDGEGAAQSPDGGGGLAGNSSNGTVASDLSRTASGGGGGETGFTRFNIGGGGGGAGQYGGLGGGGGGADLDKLASSGGGLGSSYRSEVRIPGTNYSTYGAGPATPGASISYIDFQTSTLSSARIDSAYSAALAATFGASGSPDAWTASPALPSGLALDPNSGVIAGTPTTASTGTYTFTATKYGSGSFISARSSIDLVLTVSADPALTPAFGAATSTSDGFTFSVTNFDASYAWGATSTAGSVSVSGAGLVTVSGISAGGSSTVTVTTQRSGYLSGSVQKTGNASSATPTPTPSNSNIESAQPSGSSLVSPQLRTNPPGVFTLTQGVFDRISVIENSGGIARFTINPELPQGTSINPGSGVIQGTPANVTVPTTFEITATNAAGTSTAKVLLQVTSPTEIAAATSSTVDSVRFLKHSSQPTAKVLEKLATLMQKLGPEPITLRGMIPASGRGAALARKRAVVVRKHLRSHGIKVESTIDLAKASNSTMTRRVLLTQSP